MINISLWKLRFLFFILFFSFLHSSLQIDITISNSTIVSDISTKDKEIFYRGTFAPSSEVYKYFRLKIVNKKTGGYSHIFISDKSDKPTYADSIEKSLLPSSLLYIPLTAFSQDNTVKIRVECKDSCTYELYYRLDNVIEMEDDATIDLSKYNRLQHTEIPIKTSLLKGTDAGITKFEISDLDTNSDFIVTVQANAMKEEASELLVYPAGTTITKIVPEGKSNTLKYIIIGGSIVFVALLLVGLFLW